ncbi:MAG TPA: hypothetical protein VLF60_04865 [Candidatus Saccharimonadales bacterium]|nr:hypothetical protein [Candidatus Saccharimonadales bacterium]
MIEQNDSFPEDPESHDSKPLPSKESGDTAAEQPTFEAEQDALTKSVRSGLPVDAVLDEIDTAPESFSHALPEEEPEEPVHEIPQPPPARQASEETLFPVAQTENDAEPFSPADSASAADDSIAPEKIQPDTTENGALPEIVVDLRYIGPHKVTAVHTPVLTKHVPAIAAELEDCDVIVIVTNVYEDESDRLEEERIHNAITSSQTDPKLIQEAAADAAGYGHFSLSLAAEMKATDTEIRLVAPVYDDFDDDILEFKVEARKEYNIAFRELLPIADARAATRLYIDAMVAANNCTVEGMSDQLQATIAGISEDNPGASIGIVTSKADYALMGYLEEDDELDSPGGLRDRIEATLPFLDRARHAAAEGDMRRSEEFIDKHLLVKYINRVMEVPPDSITFEQYVAPLQAWFVEAHLDMLGPWLISPFNNSVALKTEQLRNATRALIGELMDDYFQLSEET